MEKNENLERTYFKKVKNYGECSKSIVSQSEVEGRQCFYSAPGCSI